MVSKLDPPADIGFIGVGNMGAPMAHHLAGAGYRLHIMDADAGAVERFAADNDCVRGKPGVPWGADCAAVITMLPNGDIVRDVLLEDDGVAEALAPGTLVIDMSSSSPLGTRNLARELDALGLGLVDAPVSGGVVKARDGTLAIMAGGEAETVERCRPLLETMGKVFHAGPVASGHAMKSLNNFLSAGTLALTAEAVLAGTRFGLEPERMVEIINASTGRSNSSEHKYPTFILNRKFDSGFALGLMAKDLKLALELARDSGTPLELIEDISDLWSRAVEKLGTSADNTDIVRYLESLARTHG